jgi:hypothetical protein
MKKNKLKEKLIKKESREEMMGKKVVTMKSSIMKLTVVKKELF